MVNLRQAMQPRSDQLNADDLIAGPMTFTIAAVTAGTAEQPVSIHVTDPDFKGRPYKPSKGMIRVLVTGWGVGQDGQQGQHWVGRSLTLYRDPNVRFGPETVGGIKVSHMSNIAKRLEIALTVRRGRREGHTVEPLVVAVVSQFDALKDQFTADIQSGKATKAAVLEWLSGQEKLTPEQITYIQNIEVKNNA